MIFHLNIIVFETNENNHTLSQSSHLSVMANCDCVNIFWREMIFQSYSLVFTWPFAWHIQGFLQSDQSKYLAALMCHWSCAKTWHLLKYYLLKTGLKKHCSYLVVSLVVLGGARPIKHCFYITWEWAKKWYTIIGDLDTVLAST